MRIAVIACLAFPLACLSALAATPASSQTNGARPAAAAFGREGGQWLMPAKDYASTRYSGLAQGTRKEDGGSATRSKRRSAAARRM